MSSIAEIVYEFNEAIETNRIHILQFIEKKHRKSAGERRWKHLVNNREFFAETPLERAISGGQYEMVRYLINQGAEVDGTNTMTTTPPLVKAIYNKTYGIIKLLIKAGVNVNQQGEGGETALTVAVEQGDLRSVRYLVRAGAKVTSNVLQEAASQNNHRVFDMLIASPHVDINASDSRNITALHIAAANGSSQVVKLLLQCDDVDVTLVDDDGLTPLMYAVINEHELIVAMLVDTLDCNVNQRDCQGRTVLQMAVALNNKVILQHLLTCYGINMNKHKAAMKMAMHHHQQDLINMLLEAGASPSCRTSSSPSTLSSYDTKRVFPAHVLVA